MPGQPASLPATSMLGGLAIHFRFFLENHEAQLDLPVHLSSRNLEANDRCAPERARLRLWAFGGLSLISKTSFDELLVTWSPLAHRRPARVHVTMPGHREIHRCSSAAAATM